MSLYVTFRHEVACPSCEKVNVGYGCGPAVVRVRTMRVKGPIIGVYPPECTACGADLPPLDMATTRLTDDSMRDVEAARKRLREKNRERAEKRRAARGVEIPVGNRVEMNE